MYSSRQIWQNNSVQKHSHKKQKKKLARIFYPGSTAKRKITESLAWETIVSRNFFMGILIEYVALAPIWKNSFRYEIFEKEFDGTNFTKVVAKGKFGKWGISILIAKFGLFWLIGFQWKTQNWWFSIHEPSAGEKFLVGNIEKRGKILLVAAFCLSANENSNAKRKMHTDPMEELLKADKSLLWTWRM